MTHPSACFKNYECTFLLISTVYVSTLVLYKSLKKGSFIGNHKVNLVYFPQWCGKPWSSHCESNKLWSSCVYVTVYYPSLWLYFQCVITSVILQLSHTLFIKVITFVTKLWNFLSKYVHITFLFTNQQILGNHFFSKAPHFRKKKWIICRPTIFL